jgi:alanine dehydrogenase
MEVTLLTSEEIRQLITLREVIEVVEEAFKQKGEGGVQMPPKVYISFERGDFRTMPAYLPAMRAAGVKIVNVHPKNPSLGLPTVMATVLLLSPETGEPLAVMDGTWITAARTGAAGAVASKYLARGNSKEVGIVGAGVQARYQLLALAEVMEVDKVRVTSLTKAEEYAIEMRKLGFDVEPAPIREVVEKADILATTTPVTEPIVRNEWVREGIHINAIGADAPGKEELDPFILKRAKIVVDDYEQACHSGEVNVPLSRGLLRREEIYGELGEIVAGKKRGRESEREITIFDSTGLAVQDVAVAWVVYKKAEKKGVGRRIRLIS